MSSLSADCFNKEMTREELCSKINEALDAYFGNSVRSYEPYGNGHINDTFLVICGKRYIMQRMNHQIFTEPEKMMDNILGVTNHIRKKTAEAGEDTERCTLTVVPTLEGASYFKDSIGSYWRLYDFVEGTVTHETVESPADFYTCAKAFGKFQRQLADYDAKKLYPTILNFHCTPVRYDNLMKSVEKNISGRADSVRAEIDFAMARKDFVRVLEEAREQGSLPLRVTHNDTKLNNILFDSASEEPICVIDLDTVMPGYSVTDFGDSIRFGANTAAEDETDLSRVSLDMELFELYAKGFIEGCDGKLTDSELDLLPEGAIMMTLECGMRFLTDYIDGDVYFRVHREGHNLDRCRNQFALVADMERKLPQMREIINRLK